MKQLSDSCHDETNKKPLYATGGVWLMKDPVVKRSTYKQAASRSSKATASYIRLLKSLGLEYQKKKLTGLNFEASSYEIKEFEIDVS